MTGGEAEVGKARTDTEITWGVGSHVKTCGSRIWGRGTEASPHAGPELEVRKEGEGWSARGVSWKARTEG